MPTILDFQIQPLSAETYSLTVCERGSSQPLASATFSHRVDFLTDFSVDRLNASTKDAAERFDELQKLGRELYQKLFSPAVEQVWHEYKQRSEFLILCLRFAEAAAKLEVLPWETLHDGTEFIAAGAKTTLTRLPLDVAPPGELPLIPRPLKLFGFFASPLDLGDHERLNAEREQEILLEAINDPVGQGRISADFEDEAKLEILERRLRDGYHILHFTGHGISPRDGGGLLLEDAHGKKLPASIAEVMQAIESGVDKLRLAVISGCQTARTLHTGDFRDMARELLLQRVPAVIGMQFYITDDGGLKFAEILYKEIAKGVELERAVHVARRNLLYCEQAHLKNDAFAPVLLAASGNCLKMSESEITAVLPTIDVGWHLPLPQLAQSFYGRRREYRQLCDALLQRNQRAVIIHGIGGIGKTAFVSHAATRLRKRFRGVYAFDDGGNTLAPERVIAELHRYFELQGIQALQKWAYQPLLPEVLATHLAQVLSQWPLLLIFDNFETQLERAGDNFRIADEALRTFLTTLVKATATGSRFLFTSRYLFDVDNKRLGNIQSLPLGDLSRSESLMMMQKLPHLAAATHGEKLAAYQTFGGHPYALVALDCHCNFRKLSDALANARLIRTELHEFLAIEINYARLSNEARELLNRLAAFRQAVPVEVAKWVMGERITLPELHLRAAKAAVKQAVFEVMAESKQGEELREIMVKVEDEIEKTMPGRFLDHLQELKQDEEFQRALVEHEERWPEQRQAPDLTCPIAELIEWGLLTPHVDEGQLEALSVHNLVRDFCREQQVGERWRSRLRDAAAFYTNQTKLMEQDDKSQSEVWGEMEAFELLMEAEDYEDAAMLLMNAHALLARWGFSRYVESQYPRLLGKMDRRADAVITKNLAVLAHDCCKFEQSLNGLEEVERIFVELDSRSGVAASLHLIGRVYQNRGEYEAALVKYEKSLKIWEELGNRAGEAPLLSSIGVLHGLRGDYKAALAKYEQSLKLYEELCDQEGVARSLAQIGSIHHECGEPEVALVWFERSLRIMEDLDYLAGQAYLLLQIGILYQGRGKHEAALTQYRQSLRIAEDLGDRQGVASSRAAISDIFTRHGRYVEALELVLLALDAFEELQLMNAGTKADGLKAIRAEWGRKGLFGKRNFDIAWRQMTGEDVPDWLTQ